jgi:hypothetical protein
MDLMEHQLDAAEQLGSGKILWGGVGSGKSATVLAYYDKEERPKDIYVITTAKKRDSLDWEKEAIAFGIGTERLGDHPVILIDSWNQIGSYTEVKDAFFIFDEQRLVGTGSWVKSFIKIARQNSWVMLTATPGDTWLDYAPVFIANGFYKNITRFKFEHVLYEPYTKFPKVRAYLNERKLELLRNDILVEMPYLKHTTRYLNYVPVAYNVDLFKRVYKDRWNPYENRPIKDVAEMFRLMRRVVNSDPSRLEEMRFLMGFHPKLVVFYNFNYELDMLRSLGFEVPIFEWNGHKKDPIPQGERWLYLVQYIAGAEAWNCTETDAMVLYSLTYSYKNFEQAQGRIDRINTEFSSLYYYIFLSDSKIDVEIKKALGEKRNFNEKKFMANLPKL